MPHPPTLAPLARRWRRHGPAARALAAAGMLALAGLAAASLLELLPREHAMTISGGDLTGNRHFLARALQETAAGNGVTLSLRPTGGSQEALALVAAGKLDLAFIQGGLDLPDRNVVQVATVAPELLHFLARPDIDAITALRGRRVNLNSQKGGTRLIAHQVLAFAGLRAGIDYIESNIPTDQLLEQRGERLPDAIVVTSFAPSDVVDYLVKQQGYHLLEVPFAPAFALRHAWAADAEIGACTYGGAPPVPPRAIKTVGIKLRLVANRRVEARAIVKLLETLYGPALAARLPIRLDEAAILSAGGPAPSEGTRRFIDRDKPLFSRALLEQLKAAIGLAASVFSAVLVVLKWFNAGPSGDAPAGDDRHKE
ncbi:TAXI family TRAP transporter solute-binding subunit [Burkholderia sp. LMU1-1-1.1]|uniref:TAXI family TRAP transporter solute-binding subunit n=1 Tax=Burkholderia sp. LMU1-1-1.1 TaxID=3135266 RepID=UPI003449FE99